MQNLPFEKRAALSKLLRSKRIAAKLGQAALAEAAEDALRVAANPTATDENREIWGQVEVTWRHVAALENCPARPLENPERVARLLGVVLVLERLEVGLDRAQVNQLAGAV